jgi:hypothetical protein
MMECYLAEEKTSDNRWVVQAVYAKKAAAHEANIEEARGYQDGESVLSIDDPNTTVRMIARNGDYAFEARVTSRTFVSS